MTKIKKIAKYFGSYEQTKKLLEETIELKEALQEYLEHKGNFAHVLEEIVDVNVVSEQIVYLYNKNKEFKKVKKFKINRTLKRFGIK